MLVQTLLVRDEADIVDAQIAYHLNAGVDFVVAIDHESSDGTTEILEEYARDGHLRRIPETGGVKESSWRTRMARLAASDHGADWVINTDVDEFWIPRGGSLKDVLGSVEPPYGVVWGLSRHFPPRPGGQGLFAERMTVRVSSSAPISDPTSPYRPHAKVAHRGDPDVFVGRGGHAAHTRKFLPLPHWYAAEVFHFPFRSLEQFERKGMRGAAMSGWTRLAQYDRVVQAREAGTLQDRYEALVVDDDTLARGTVAGSLVVDTRLRDALRALGTDPGGEAPVSGSDDGLIAESAALRDADVVRLTRHVDELRRRLNAL
jgi:hypothetical protein